MVQQVMLGRTDEVLSLLEQGYDVNRKAGEAQFTPFHLLCGKSTASKEILGVCSFPNYAHAALVLVAPVSCAAPARDVARCRC